MVAVESPDANFKRYLPESLAECTSEQYIAMSELIMMFQYCEISYQDMKVAAIYKLLNLKHVENKDSEIELEKMSNVYLLSNYIDNFFDKNGEELILKQDYVHNPVPEQKVLLTKFYGPSDNFMNMTFGEYTDALRMIHDFRVTTDSKLLYILAAIFYRPKKSFHFVKKHLPKYDNDIRVQYNSHQIEKRANKFKYAPIGFIYGFYLLFTSFQKYLVEAKILWAGNEIDLSILFQSSSDEPLTDLPSIGMDAIAFTMAESGTFGTLEQVKNTNFWEIIIRMYDLRRADLEKQKQYDAANKPN